MEELTKIRLDGHDREIKDIKVEVKGIGLSVHEIEKTDIRIEINMQSILDTYKVIRNTTIAFVVLNVLTMLWTISSKL